MALPFHKLLQTLSSGSSIGSAAVAILASYGTDAHIYLPGAAVPVLGPELVTNGDLSAGSTGWNVSGAWTIGSGKLTGVGTGSPTHADHTASYNSIVPGREYLVTFDVVNITGSSTITFYIRGGAGAVLPSSTGPVSLRYIAGSSTYGYGPRFTLAPAGTSLEIDNLSVKEIISYTDTLNGYTLGNWLDSGGTTPATVDNPVGLVQDGIGTIHASQGTTANKPILRKPSNNYYWEFDGTNDSLASTSAPFQMADDHCVVMGVSRTAVATEKHPFHVGATASVNPLAARIAFAADGTVNAHWRDDSTTLFTAASGATYTAGVPLVVSARKTGNNKVCRVNGVAGAVNSSAVGATATLDKIVFGNHNAGYFDGREYATLNVKGTISDANLLILERWVGSLTGPTGVVIP